MGAEGGTGLLKTLVEILDDFGGDGLLGVDSTGSWNRKSM